MNSVGNPRLRSTQTSWLAAAVRTSIRGTPSIGSAAARPGGAKPVEPDAAGAAGRPSLRWVCRSAGKIAEPAGSVPAVTASNGAVACAAGTPSVSSWLSVRTAVGESTTRAYASARPASTPPRIRVGRRTGSVRGENWAPRGIEVDVGAPEEAVAPGGRRRVQLVDVVGDVHADAERGVDQTAAGLGHPDDVRALVVVDRRRSGSPAGPPRPRRRW